MNRRRCGRCCCARSIPNLLAHGHTAGTDLGVTLFMVSSVWVWTAALKRSSWKRAALAGLLAGAAFSTKYSSAWLVPILALITLLYPGVRDQFLRRIGFAVLAGVLALSVIWATFQFSIRPDQSRRLACPCAAILAIAGRPCARASS